MSASESLSFGIVLLIFQHIEAAVKPLQMGGVGAVAAVGGTPPLNSEFTVWGGGWLAQLGANFGLGHGHVEFAGSSRCWPRPAGRWPR